VCRKPHYITASLAVLLLQLLLRFGRPSAINVRSKRSVVLWQVTAVVCRSAVGKEGTTKSVCLIIIKVLKGSEFLDPRFVKARLAVSKTAA
jgi:hypothetical protein